MGPLDSQVIASLQERLDAHPVYGAVRSLEHLRCFMEHHVYSVWDFMSLIKFLQASVAPTHVPWVPLGDAAVRRFINELVLEEESDQVPPAWGGDGGFCSHFELYCAAMREIGADDRKPAAFVEAVRRNGVACALESVPGPARMFTLQTFRFIDGGKPHVAAAALALGREHIIPSMFRAFLQRLGVSEEDAPTFHFYLNRHVHLDQDFHAPLSLRLLNGLCGDDQTKRVEALEAARAAVQARVAFWDGVLEALCKRCGAPGSVDAGP